MWAMAVTDLRELGNIQYDKNKKTLKKYRWNYPVKPRN